MGSPVAVTIGFLVTLLITAGVQAFQLRPNQQPRDDGFAVDLRLALFELIATPIALGAAYFIMMLSYDGVFGYASSALWIVGGGIAFLVWSVAAVMAFNWRKR